MRMNEVMNDCSLGTGAERDLIDQCDLIDQGSSIARKKKHSNLF